VILLENEREFNQLNTCLGLMNSMRVHIEQLSTILQRNKFIDNNTRIYIHDIIVSFESGLGDIVNEINEIIKNQWGLDEEKL